MCVGCVYGCACGVCVLTLLLSLNLTKTIFNIIIAINTINDMIILYCNSIQDDMI